MLNGRERVVSVSSSDWRTDTSHCKCVGRTKFYKHDLESWPARSLTHRGEETNCRHALSRWIQDGLCPHILTLNLRLLFFSWSIVIQLVHIFFFLLKVHHILCWPLSINVRQCLQSTPLPQAHHRKSLDCAEKMPQLVECLSHHIGGLSSQSVAIT